MFKELYVKTLKLSGHKSSKIFLPQTISVEFFIIPSKDFNPSDRVLKKDNSSSLITFWINCFWQ